MNVLRKEERLDLDINVYSQDRELIGYVKNITSGGFFIKTNKKFDKEFLSLSLCLPCTHQKIDVVCKIIWKQNDGIGVKNIMDDQNKSFFANCLEGLDKLKEINYPSIEKTVKAKITYGC